MRIRQRGIVLAIALIVMVAMSLTAAALVRSVDVTIAVIGNLGFREASIVAADAGLEEAIATLASGTLLPERERDLPAQSYYAWRQPGEDSRGVPLALQKLEQYSKDARVLDAGNGNSVRYIIERLCTSAAPASPAHCNLVGDAPQHATFRITIRVDGPQNAVSHVQVMLRDPVPLRRVAWRIIGD
jgi:Tfp pilus assembly protein PilX